MLCKRFLDGLDIAVAGENLDQIFFDQAMSFLRIVLARALASLVRVVCAAHGAVCPQVGECVADRAALTGMGHTGTVEELLRAHRDPTSALVKSLHHSCRSYGPVRTTCALVHELGWRKTAPINGLIHLVIVIAVSKRDGLFFKQG